MRWEERARKKARDRKKMKEEEKGQPGTKRYVRKENLFKLAFLACLLWIKAPAMAPGPLLRY